MKVLYATLVFSCAIAYLARLSPHPTGRAPYYQKPNVAGYFAIALMLSIVSGLRSSYVDTKLYMEGFKSAPPSKNIFSFAAEAFSEKSEWGFAVLQDILKHILYDPQILIFSVALITNFLFIKVIYNYAQPYELGVYLYITMGIYLSTMNGIRQYLAASLIFVSVKWLLNGSWKKFFIVVLIASTFHVSAIIMIPIYFVVRRKAWGINTFIILILSAVFFLIFPVILPQIAGLLEGSKETADYANRIAASEVGGGANYIRVLVNAVPVVLAFIERKRLKAAWDKIDIIINFNILNLIIISLSTYNALISRLMFYTAPFQIILLCFIIGKAFDFKNKKLFLLLVIILYFIYFVYWSSVKMHFTYVSDMLGVKVT